MSTWNGRQATGAVTHLEHQVDGKPVRCGCVHDERRWLAQCEPHLLDWYTRHQAAASAHAAADDDSGFWCDRCQHWYRGDNQCPRHGR